MKSVTNPLPAAILALLAVSCSIGPIDGELNLAFTIDRNQLLLDGVRIGGDPGRFVAATAFDQTLLDTSWASRRSLSAGRSTVVVMSEKTTDRVDISLIDLSGEIDALIGRDLLGPVTIIDYQNQLITRRNHVPEPLSTKPFRWKGKPAHPIVMNGKRTIGIIDTAIPDTIVVPKGLMEGRSCERCSADVEIAGVHFGDLPVTPADIDRIRIGNRVLRHFLVTIDYPRRTASLTPVR
ncbi:MAG: hypothetical protein R3338_13680 [Thermoanaerobaculia bacterium]|nr:hypothetical protein [Thermoanaerobaculia bacterium]